MKYTFFLPIGLMAIALNACKKSPESDSAQQAELSKESKGDAVEEVAEAVTPEALDEEVAVEAETELKKRTSSWTEEEEIKLMQQSYRDAASDPEASVDFLLAAPESTRRTITFQAVAERWAEQDRAAAIQKADSLEDEGLKNVMRGVIVATTTPSEVPDTIAWVKGWQNAPSSLVIDSLKTLEIKADPDAVDLHGHTHAHDGHGHSHEPGQGHTH